MPINAIRTAAELTVQETLRQLKNADPVFQRAFQMVPETRLGPMVDKMVDEADRLIRVALDVD